MARPGCSRPARAQPGGPSYLAGRMPWAQRPGGKPRQAFCSSTLLSPGLVCVQLTRATARARPSSADPGHGLGTHGCHCPSDHHLKNTLIFLRRDSGTPLSHVHFLSFDF